MKTKIIQLFNNSLKPKLIMFDAKINSLVPNPKIKKILYIGVGSLFGFMFLIILLGLLLSPFRNNTVDLGTKLNKPNIVSVSPEPQKELSETQKEILNLENRIKELRFPESILNIPVIERDLSI
mgnify:FL=1